MIFLFLREVERSCVRDGSREVAVICCCQFLLIIMLMEGLMLEGRLCFIF